MKIVVTIFLLPYEIDDLDRIVNQLKMGSYLLSGNNEWVMDVTLCVANDMVDWKKSSIPKSYFVDRLHSMVARADWCEASFKCSDDIKGCVSQRRTSLERYPDADYFIWLDCDIIFSERTLTFFEQAAEKLLATNPMVIITPEIVRIWDHTWDCLVNEQYKSKPLGYQKNNDPFKDAGVKGNVSLEQVHNRISGQPRFKIAGGWFTCISGKLLSRLGIPVSFGHYGLEDTFVMLAAEKIIKMTDAKVEQYKLKNLLVCENYKYRGHEYLDKHLSMINRKEEFRKVASDAFNSELSRIR